MYEFYYELMLQYWILLFANLCIITHQYLVVVGHYKQLRNVVIYLFVAPTTSILSSSPVVAPSCNIKYDNV